MLDISKLDPTIKLDIRYATTNNFTKQVLYPEGRCLLVEPVAHRLIRVQAKLQKKGLGLKLWDCYRPVSVQQKLWDVVPDDRYVANPKNGSRHNRGSSIDLTLIDKNGQELEMPTPFDTFTHDAHRDYYDLPKHVLKNRDLLQDAMESEGFIGLRTEWWHFDAPDWQNYALRNEPLTAETLHTDQPAHFTNMIEADNVTQLITVVSKSWSDTVAELQRYEKLNGQWRKVGKPWDVSLGSKGLAWGRGHFPKQSDGPQKTEGDKKSPAGIFKVGQAYGQSNEKPAHSKWNYQALDDNWICVDDPASMFYNRVMDKTKAFKTDWKSAEKMNRNDHLYKWVINIEHNFPDTVKPLGSCIFFHVWRKEKSSTRGCTAMEEKNIVDLLKWLDPTQHPYLVQLPREVYNTYQKQGKLP